MLCFLFPRCSPGLDEAVQVRAELSKTSCVADAAQDGLQQAAAHTIDHPK